MIKKTLKTVFLFAGVFLLAKVFALNCVALTKPFNDNWKFSLGDNSTFKEKNFDDSSWRNLNVPHDWSFENGYKEKGSQGEMGGYGIGGVGLYRKTFSLTKADLETKHIFIDFDGVYMNSEVWINGHYLGKRVYGYIAFSYEMTKFLKEGENLLTVRVDNSKEPSARWYHGCGIYGNVWLRYENSTYFEKDGIFLQTPEITKSSAKVDISAEIISDLPKNAKLELTIFDSAQKEIAKNTSSLSLKEAMQVVSISSEVKSPKLWSPESPNLYKAKLEIFSDSKELLDTQEITFGVRSAEWKAKTGFYLNGKQYKLQGVCDHLEGAATGAISTKKLWQWRVGLLKDMGCNAIRTAHNPFVPEFYEVCNEMGMLVLDEVFDGWRQKALHDYGGVAFDKDWQKDLTAFIRRDRNNPCVFLYSMGNETHGKVSKSLVALCHKLDPTRLVTSGSSANQDMDVDGNNGGSENLEFMRKYKVKNKPFIGTENPHTWQVRGYYRSQTWYRNGYPNAKQKPEFIPNLTEKEIFAYDWIDPKKRRNAKQVLNSSFDNATKTITARHSIELLRKYDWYAGSFRWTGFDYRGEAGYVHGGFPFKAFMGGALDLAGFEKDLYYLYQSEWTNKDMAHISPHWTHPKMPAGELVPVRVYTTGDEAELFLNGKSLGKRQKGSTWDTMQLDWLVAWQEGTLELVSYRKGKEIARAYQKTSKEPSKLGLSLSEPLKADGQDIVILTIAQTDEDGTVYPYGENRIYAKIFGKAKLLSFESGSPVDVENNYEAESKKCFFGLNRIFVQSTSAKDESDASMILASISGDKHLMLSDKVTINVEEIALRGNLNPKKLEVFYTTDGSAPSKNTTAYSGAFSVKLGTTVRAIVYNGDEVIFDMQEDFGKGDALYWGDVNAPEVEFLGEQAEYAKLNGAKVVEGKGKGYKGSGYVEFTKAGGSISFYQENDSEPYETRINIRYAMNFKNGKPRSLKLFNNDKFIKLLNFKDTKSINAKWEVLTTKIPLNSGANNIRLESIMVQAPNIDQIEIEN